MRQPRPCTYVRVSPPPLTTPPQVSKLSKWSPAGARPDTLTAINTEWGCYGSSLLPRTPEDLELDAASGSVKGGSPGCVCGCVLEEGRGGAGAHRSCLTPPVFPPPHSPGLMLIEKLMSGLWMGDCARRHMLTFARKVQLFGPKVMMAAP